MISDRALQPVPPRDVMRRRLPYLLQVEPESL